MEKIERMVGVRYVDAPPGQFILVAPLRGTYKLPKNRDKKRKLERQLITVTPQDDDLHVIPLEVSCETNIEFEAKYESKQHKSIAATPIEKEIRQKPPSRNCKKCGNIMSFIYPCCDDKVAGIIEKWHCSQCRYILKVKEATIRNS